MKRKVAVVGGMLFFSALFFDVVAVLDWVLYLRLLGNRHGRRLSRMVSRLEAMSPFEWGRVMANGNLNIGQMSGLDRAVLATGRSAGREGWLTSKVASEVVDHTVLWTFHVRRYLRLGTRIGNL